ncbi:hypothetical protein GCM10010149_65720 [Nonomuraea roseoviolacea subsp. roseoviolacea]|uniref:hypothetical protein n=1 Tax=Nonomuraea roseoviolacea TaxID=103837 RepID=UPI0031DAFEC0
MARDPDPADGRRVITAITDKGRAAVASRDLVITERLAPAVDTLRRHAFVSIW